RICKLSTQDDYGSRPDTPRVGSVAPYSGYGAFPSGDGGRWLGHSVSRAPGTAIWRQPACRQEGSASSAWWGSYVGGDIVSGTATDELSIGVLVSVRGQRWVISDVEAGERSHLVSLQSVEDGRYGETLQVIWEVEPGRQILPSGSLPQVEEGGFDPPQRL